MERADETFDVIHAEKIEKNDCVNILFEMGCPHITAMLMMKLPNPKYKPYKTGNPIQCLQS